jgi:ankyrin repeat protein
MAAANCECHESLIQKLIQHHPRGAAQEDRNGMLPLHLACENGKDWSTTRFIYEAFPNAVRQVEHNPRGWYPLHMAAACSKEDGELIAKITEHFPEAASIPDSEGQYPLHLACSAGKNWDGGLRVLFDANPNALASRDSRGFLPVHICALSFCKQESDKPRTKAVPMVEAKKEMTVNHEEAAQLDILFNLFRSDPTTIQ